MKSQCLPFSQIPHTTKLFSDFINYSPKVQQFYPHSPSFNDWFRAEPALLDYNAARRSRVCAVLQRQNAAWNASAKALDNIVRLKTGASAVVTGQQVGLFGGPLFSIFKALTAFRLAQQADQAGVDCVPVFWLATEDHDLEEVNHIFLPGADGKLQTVLASSSGVSGAPVGTIKLGNGIAQADKSITEILGESEITRLASAAYGPDETFGSGFARWFAQLLSGWGVILLDASDPELHSIAEPIYRAAVEKAAAIDAVLQDRGNALESAGYHQQVKVTPSSSLLFVIREGARVAVHQRPASAPNSTEFMVGEETVSESQLLNQVSNSPQDFSPNVLLRPVVQDYLLPTLAYVGGPAEIAYFAQAGVVYESIGQRVTPIVPRFSATIVESKQQALLERYNLRVTDIFRSPERVPEFLAKGSMPRGLQKSFDDAEAALQKSLAGVRESLAEIDKTLVEAALTAESKMLYQLNGLRSRAARAEVRHSELLGHHAELLANSLYPHKNLQEREIAGLYFLARHGTEFLNQLYETIQTDCLDHQIISV